MNTNTKSKSKASVILILIAGTIENCWYWYRRTGDRRTGAINGNGIFRMMWWHGVTWWCVVLVDSIGKKQQSYEISVSAKPMSATSMHSCCNKKNSCGNNSSSSRLWLMVALVGWTSLILILMMADGLRIDTGAVNGNGNGRLRRMWVTCWW